VFNFTPFAVFLNNAALSKLSMSENIPPIEVIVSAVNPVADEASLVADCNVDKLAVVSVTTFCIFSRVRRDVSWTF